MKKSNQLEEVLEFPMTPITEDTFERQGWEKHEGEDVDEKNGETVKFYYYTLPLPKDNPEEDCVQLISSANDEWDDYDNLKKGEFVVEIDGSFGLGLCWTEEEIEILYKALTTSDIE